MIVVASYPKSGLHLARTLLRQAGHQTTHTHNGPMSRDARSVAPDLHVIRDVRDVVVSAVCYFVLGRPELDPEKIRPHVLEVAEAMTGPWEHAPGSGSWSDYVLAMTERARLTVTFRDLVDRPGESLAPLGVHVDPSPALAARDWSRDTFRRGKPGGWVDVLTPAQADQVLRWHAPGMLVVDELNGVHA